MTQIQIEGVTIEQASALHSHIVRHIEQAKARAEKNAMRLLGNGQGGAYWLARCDAYADILIFLDGMREDSDDGKDDAGTLRQTP